MKSNEMAKKYFAGGNTKEGFVSYYDEIFSSCDLMYIIKGGSGSGKSYFMKEVGAFAQSMGRKTEYFYCSFDSDSVDGIIIYGEAHTIGILDGTAPHVVEAKLAGVKDRIINFGEFLDTDKLHPERKEIETLIFEKKQKFKEIYSYLDAFGKIEDIKDNICKKYIKKDRISEISNEIIGIVNCNQRGKTQLRPLSSLGKNGCIRFDSFKETCENIVLLNNDFSQGYCILKEIADKAETFGLPFKISRCYFDKDKIDEILINDNLCVCISLTDEFKTKLVKSYNFTAEITENDAITFENLSKMQEYLQNETVKLLGKAFEIHSKIESIYISAMDFSKKEAYTKTFLDSIKKYL